MGVNTVEFLNDKEMMTFAYLIYETAESNSEDSKKLHDLEQLIAENAGTEEGVKKFYMHIFNRFMQTNHYQVTSDTFGAIDRWFRFLFITGNYGTPL